MIAIAHGVFPDSIALQYDVFGAFKTDIVIANRKEKKYFFIELEGAGPGSLFRKTERATTTWGSGISTAFYQIVDWFWKLDDESRTDDFQERFGDRGAEISGIIVVGRDEDVEHSDRRRLNWMNGKLRIDSRQVVVYTYDDLRSLLEEKLKLIEEFANKKDS